MTLGNRLRAARKRGGYTQKQLAQQIGAKHNSVSNWENGLNMPDPLTIECICSVLDVTPNYLLLGDEFGSVSAPQGGFNAQETEVLRKYRGLDNKAKGAVDALLDYYHKAFAVKSERPAESHAEKLWSLDKQEPVVQNFEVIHGLISSQSVAAGTGTYLDSDAFETISVQKNSLTNRAAFYVPVSGNSMEPKFHDGDILIVEQKAAAPGEIGIFTLDGNGFVKVRGQSELISLNPHYSPIPMDDDIICNGRVIGVLEPEWLIER